MKRLDFCWGCGAPTPLRCARCKKPVCVVWGSPTPAVGCAVLRKSPRDVGVYLLVCSPRCRLRRSPQVIATIEKQRPSSRRSLAPLTACAASHGDGECHAPNCPQAGDGEPEATGRTCPLPWHDDQE